MINDHIVKDYHFRKDYLTAMDCTHVLGTWDLSQTLVAFVLHCAFSNELKLCEGNWCAQTDGSLPVSYYWCQYLQRSAGPLISADVESERQDSGNRNPYFSSEARTLIYISCVFLEHETKWNGLRTFKRLVMWSLELFEVPLFKTIHWVNSHLAFKMVKTTEKTRLNSSA